MSKLEYAVKFPTDFPSAYSGVFLINRNELITGHVNGLVVRWNISNNTYKIILNFDSIVQTISNYKEEKIAIGYNSGGLYIYDLNLEKLIVIQKPTHNVNQRVWKTKWIEKNYLIMTSTYGEIRLIHFVDDEHWENYQLSHSREAVFALNNYDSRLITGDYQGFITIWDFKDGTYEATEKTAINGTIQGLYWYSEKCFAAINKSGKLYLFEKDLNNNWQISTEVDISKDRGNCVILSHDGDTIFAGTDSEIIQFDISTNLVKTIDLRNVKELYFNEENIFTLTSYGLLKFHKTSLVIPPDIINYRFKKISLLGHTGTGKSTFCNLLIYDNVEKLPSTFGKRIWNLNLPNDGDTQKRIIFLDHGGQETVLDTFLSFLNDSDIILIFYSQIDKKTFERAYELLFEVRKKVGENIDIYFVQTFIDHELDEVPYTVIDELIKKKIIKDVIEMSPSEKIGVEDFYNKVIDKIDWEKSKFMISSPYIEGINNTINIMRESKVSTISFEEFKTKYQENIKSVIPEKHLKYLLNDASNQGIIEYYPNILKDIIIIHDKLFDKMRTEIPILVDHNKGIINYLEIESKFDNKNYVKILDEMFIQSKNCFQFHNIRIFPHKLKETGLNIPQFYQDYLSITKEYIINLKYNGLDDIEINKLLEALSDLKLQCIDASKTEGLFTWNDSAFIYYIFQERGSSIIGKSINITYYVAGKKSEVIERLKNTFYEIILKLYDVTPDKTKNGVNDLKKTK